MIRAEYIRDVASLIYSIESFISYSKSWLLTQKLYK